MKKKQGLLPYMLLVSGGVAALLGFVGTLQAVFQAEPKTDFLTAVHSAILTTLQFFVLNVVFIQVKPNLPVAIEFVTATRYILVNSIGLPSNKIFSIFVFSS